MLKAWADEAHVVAEMGSAMRFESVPVADLGRNAAGHVRLHAGCNLRRLPPSPWPAAVRSKRLLQPVHILVQEHSSHRPEGVVVSAQCGFLGHLGAV